MNQLTILYRDSDKRQITRKDPQSHRPYCPCCKSHLLVEQASPYEYAGEGFSLRLEKVPSFVCGECGVVYYNHRSMERLEEIQKELKRLSQF